MPSLRRPLDFSMSEETEGGEGLGLSPLVVIGTISFGRGLRCQEESLIFSSLSQPASCCLMIPLN